MTAQARGSSTDMTPAHFAALLGFLFTAAWIGFSFGEAVLCLIGAGVFTGLLYAGEAFLRGDIDLGELQARMTKRPGPAGGPVSRAQPRAR
jgi:1,4-dihydroxy-2-naphthoate octaprenyltransferase